MVEQLLFYDLCNFEYNIKTENFRNIRKINRQLLSVKCNEQTEVHECAQNFLTVKSKARKCFAKQVEFLKVYTNISSLREESLLFSKNIYSWASFNSNLATIKKVIKKASKY